MGLKGFLKSVEQQKVRDAFRAEWMADKYALHPEMSQFDVNVKYVCECNNAMAAAGLYDKPLNYYIPTNPPPVVPLCPLKCSYGSREHIKWIIDTAK